MLYPIPALVLAAIFMGLMAGRSSSSARRLTAGASNESLDALEM